MNYCCCQHYPDMDKQRHVLGRHPALVQLFDAVHEMLLSGRQLLGVHMVDAQIILHGSELGGSQAGPGVSAEAQREQVLPLPVHRQLRSRGLAALRAALLFMLPGLDTLQRAVNLRQQLPGLVFGAERVVFWVISGVYVSQGLGVGEFVADSSPFSAAEGRHVGRRLLLLLLSSAAALAFTVIYWRQ